MTAAPLPLLTCQAPDCGTRFPRKHASGVAAKYCDECRAKRKAARGRRYSGEPGPVVEARRLVRDSNPELHARIAAASLAAVTGMGEEIAQSIVETIDVLLEAGESAEDIRRRLNPNPTGFGRTRAGTTPADELEQMITQLGG